MTDELLMRAAIDQARLALALDEVPVGCVVYHPSTDRILAAAHNLRQTRADPTAHAEMIALRQAAAALSHWRLFECTLAVTLEPCPMCAGGLVNSRMKKLIYGCPDPKAGAVRTLFQLCDDPRLNHRIEIVPGILAEECAQLLKDFFRTQRDLGKK